MKREKKAEWKGVFKGVGIVVLMIAMIGGAMAVTHITDSDITIDGVSVLLSTSNLNASKINTGTVGNSYLDTDLQDLADGTLSKSKVEDSGNWDTAYGWGDHSTAGYTEGSSLNASNISSGTLVDARIGNISGSKINTGINATNITAGTLADARLSSTVTKLGDTIESSEITDETITHSDIANVTRKLYFTPGDFRQETCGRGLLGIHPTLDFNGTTNETAYTTFQMPSDYIGGAPTVNIFYIEDDTVSSVVVFTLHSEHLVDGELLGTNIGLDSHRIVDTTSGTVMESELNVASITYSGSDTNPSANDYMTLKLVRNGADASDTDSYDISVVLVTFEYTAKM